MEPVTHRGRFAPSPTGPLHAGSLVAALGSFLNARHKRGQWLVRIEDIDPPREQPGATQSILRSLEQHGLFWDGDVMFQSQRLDVYEDAIVQLQKQGMVFYCRCSRKQIDKHTSGDKGSVYPGTCRNITIPLGDSAIRLLSNDINITTADLLQGNYTQNMASDVGDFVIKRRDNLYAYHLAVVVDDAAQGITEVVRGTDLLESTPRQQYLQQCLGLPAPAYIHLPVVSNELGQKLSKQTFAPALDDSNAQYNLYTALEFLGQQPPADLAQENVESILQWAIANWNLAAAGKQSKSSGFSGL